MKSGFYWLASLCVFVILNSVTPLTGQDNPKGIAFYVSKDGSDKYSGKLPEANANNTDGPFATIEKARDVIYALKQKKQLPTGVVTVNIRSGTYHLTKPFELTKWDSGSEKTSIVYRAYNNEKVKLIGGKEITGFKPIDDPAILKRIESPYRDKIVQVNLKAQGIKDFGEMKPRGMGRPVYPAGIELFFQDKPMQLARWPNNDWVKIAGVPAGQKGGKFTYDGDRPEHWRDTKDIWLHGYWTWDWADSYETVKTIDTVKKEVSTCEPHGVYGYSVGKRYYALNILEELDEPGEWYLDRKTGILYFWPPGPLSEGKTYVSLTDTLIQMKDVSYITLQGLEIAICRGNAVEITGGSNNRIAGCTLRNIGNVAVKITGGTENGVTGCDIYACGDGGIVLNGGDRLTLTSANNYATNNHIHNYNRWVSTYRPAIKISGVGNRISNNLIHDSPHSAIILNGNEHIIEYNEIHHVCMETNDAGAFYMGRDYSERGNIIRYNYFHDLGSGDVQAIYLDDFASGTTVFGNVIYKGKRGVVIGGGRDNIVQNNIFVSCSIAAIHVDARGIRKPWAKKYFDGTDTTLTGRLMMIKYKFPPYANKYPEIITLYDGNPAIPEGNKVICNIASGGKWLDLRDGVNEEIVKIQNNFVNEDPCFVNPTKLNFQLKDDSPAYKLGFQRIPMENIGLYKDEFRLSLPGS
ncbi:MAG: hypothetical protein BROFUL_02388 [Candidatus Brocadia fulgida]|uniref:Right handed beta helix domain-containing protein n=1 Tax=Candidatus Brocadia fulgida TaxID=380242 RepID=A0A0M2UWM4_9BACT|nr:MAG: hypothetical protein BROFUL_02388 [Candidatus Brocadia fulgida]